MKLIPFYFKVSSTLVVHGQTISRKSYKNKYPTEQFSPFAICFFFVLNFMNSPKSQKMVWPSQTNDIDFHTYYPKYDLDKESWHFFLLLFFNYHVIFNIKSIYWLNCEHHYSNMRAKVMQSSRSSRTGTRCKISCKVKALEDKAKRKEISFFSSFHYNLIEKSMWLLQIFNVILTIY